jgi:phage-related protein
MFAIQFSGVTIDYVTRWENNLPSNYTIDSFPRRDGGIGPQRAPVPKRVVTLSGKYFGSSAAALDSYFDTLLATLYRTGRGKLYQKDNNRYVNAHISGYNDSDSVESPGICKPFSFQFECDDPFFYDGQSQSVLSANVTTSPFNIAVVNNGLFETPPLFEVKALGSAVTGVTIYNTSTGLFVRYSGTINAGATLSIDCADMTALANGTTVLNLITGTQELFLAPGANNIQYQGPTTGVDVNVVWLERWL